MEKENKWFNITLGAIKYISESKKAQNKEPTHATTKEIIELTNKAIKTALNKLVEKGEIIEHDGMHEKMYSLKK